MVERARKLDLVRFPPIADATVLAPAFEPSPARSDLAPTPLRGAMADWGIGSGDAISSR